MAADDIIKKIQDLLNSSTRLSSATKQNFKDQLDLLAKQGAELSRFQALYDSIGDSVDAISDSLGYAYDSLKDSVNELQKQNVYLNAQKSALNKISDIARTTLSIRRGETELNTKKLAKLKLETTERIRQLEFSKKRANITQFEIDAINTQISTANELYKAFNEILKTDKEFNKELGLGPKILSGFDKALSKLGMPSLGITEALSETKMLHQEAKATGQQFSIWKTFSGKVLDNFKGIFTSANLIQSSIGFLVEALVSSDKATGSLAKDFNMTYDEASNVRNELIQISNSSKDISLNARTLNESLVVVGKTLGTNAKLNEADLKTFTQLREKAGFANDELASMQRTTLATGGNLKKNVSSLMFAAKTTALNNKVLLNEKDIMRDVSKASDAVKLSLAGNPAALGRAAAQAKALGMNLEQVDKIADSLLNFEQSISAELEAELLTGKDLNLEQARLYAINNDMEGLSRELAKNFGTAANFSKMNRLQQEAAAKAVGMNRDELAKTLTDQEALKNISKEDLGTAQAALAAARAKGMSEEEIAKQGINNLMKQQSVQERLGNAVEKLKEIFISIAEPIMAIVSPIVDALLPTLSVISGVLGSIMNTFGGILKYIVPIVAAVGTFLAISKSILAVKELIILATQAQGRAEMLSRAKAVGNFMLDIGKYALKSGLAVASIPVVGPILAIAAIAAAVAGGMALYSKFNKGDDIVSPGYGQRTLMGPEGAIALNNKDTVIAGTNLFDKGNDTISEPGKTPSLNPAGSIKVTPSSPSSSPSIDYNALANAVVSALNKAPINVNVEGKIDGNKLIQFVGKSVSEVTTESSKFAVKAQ